QRRGLRRLGGGRFEVPAVLEPTELSLLEIKGYNVIVVGEAKTLLRQRLRAHSNVSGYSSDDDFFASVASNQGYMTVDYIETWIANLVDVFPLLVELVPMPNPTWEGRQSRAVRLSAGSEGNRPAVVFISGVHAGELAGPDACIYFLYRLIN